MNGGGRWFAISVVCEGCSVCTIIMVHAPMYHYNGTLAHRLGFIAFHTANELNDIRGTQNTIAFLRNSLLIWGTPKHQGIPMEFLDICIPQGVGKGIRRPR